MQAAQKQMDVAANNVANSDTPGYSSQRANIVDLSGGGANVAGISESPAPGSAQPEDEQGSHVDLPTEMVNMTRASLLYSANAAVVKIGQKMTGSLLDILDRPNRQESDLMNQGRGSPDLAS